MSFRTVPFLKPQSDASILQDMAARSAIISEEWEGERCHTSTAWFQGFHSSETMASAIHDLKKSLPIARSHGIQYLFLWTLTSHGPHFLGSKSERHGRHGPTDRITFPQSWYFLRPPGISSGQLEETAPAVPIVHRDSSEFECPEAPVECAGPDLSRHTRDVKPSNRQRGIWP